MSDKPSSISTDIRHDNEFLQQAYGLSDLPQAQQFYERWAEQYDSEMEGELRYIAPRQLAEMAAKHLSHHNIEVLDVGCGTGLTSHYLHELGLRTFDGIDITPQMLNRARARGIYRTLVEADITKPLALADAQYDLIISSGTFTLGHVDSQPIPELLRVLKPHGYFALTVHADLWQAQGFEHTLQRLVDLREVHQLDFSPGEFFEELGTTALYCVYQKL